MHRAAVLGLWISELKARALPLDLTAQMRNHILDTIGAIIVGNGRAPVRLVEPVFAAGGDVPVLIDGHPRDLRDATRVNAIAAHAAEIDDTEGCDHTGAVVVSTLMALALDPNTELRNDELLCAAVAGYEVGRRVQNALGGYDAANETGWHSTATCGVFAAAAAAARALALTPEQCTSALAIAASSSAGGWAFSTDGSLTKQLHIANAAGNGVQAALLARAGVTGPDVIFDDNVWGGFFATHGSASATPDALVEGLGLTWHARHSAIKMYAACRSAHAALDGIADLLAARAIDPHTVTKVEIRTSPLLSRMICLPSPRTVEAARMSLPISIAFQLLGRPLDPDTYEGYRDAAVTELVSRMRVVDRTDLPSQQWVEVDLTVCAGTTSETHRIAGDTARGAEGQPFSADDVREKFRRLTVSRIDADTSERIIAVIGELGETPTTVSAELGFLSSLWI